MMFIVVRNITDFLSPVSYDGKSSGHIEHNVINLVVVFLSSLNIISTFTPPQSTHVLPPIVAFLLLAATFFFFSKIYHACSTCIASRNRPTRNVQMSAIPSISRPFATFNGCPPNIRPHFRPLHQVALSSDSHLSEGTLEAGEDIGKLEMVSGDEVYISLNAITPKRTRPASTFSGDTVVDDGKEETENFHEISRPLPAHFPRSGTSY